MTNVTFFDTLGELRMLTGLASNKALWNAGFNLDDWDFGFVSDVEWFESWGDPYYMNWILDRMADYCCGYRHTKYNGRHYYILFHS